MNKTINKGNSFIHHVFLLDAQKFPIFDFLQHIFPNSNSVGGIPKLYEKRPVIIMLIMSGLCSHTTALF